MFLDREETGNVAQGSGQAVGGVSPPAVGYPVEREGAIAMEKGYRLIE